VKARVTNTAAHAITLEHDTCRPDIATVAATGAWPRRVLAPGEETEVVLVLARDTRAPHDRAAAMRLHRHWENLPPNAKRVAALGGGVFVISVLTTGAFCSPRHRPRACSRPRRAIPWRATSSRMRIRGSSGSRPWSIAWSVWNSA
jgi:hypothetical protein